MSWLPTSKKEMIKLGWEQPDVIIFTGDAYIDHPSFGAAVIARWLEYLNLKVAVIPQPNWRDDLRDFKKLGPPKLFFAVTSGNMDSMVNHYTANKRLRSDDAFTPGGKAGARPDYAVAAYSKILKQLFPEIPVIIGGIEASLRRFAHYDYWSNTLKPSVLIDSDADLLVYGMGEKPLKYIVERVLSGESINQIYDIPQTAYLLKDGIHPGFSEDENQIELHSFKDCLKDKLNYAKNFRIIEEESNKWTASRLTEMYPGKNLIVNPPFNDFSQEEIDAPYNLPYMRMPHPRYMGKEIIPAYEMIRDSVNIHRGCFGGCSFCTISAHQGKQIQSRSEESIFNEIQKVIETPGFKGNLSDVGGPSANMYRMKGKDLSVCRKCKRPSCIFPSVCNNLNASHSPLTKLYKKISSISGIKKAYIGSGIRYDLFYGTQNDEYRKQAKEYFKQLVLNHVSGRLKVAPEHSSEKVLKLMRKPSFEMFLKLRSDFNEICKQANKNQQVIPYLISSHPASKVEDMADLAINLNQIGYRPEQVQDFTPTPLTLSSVIYFTGVDPYTLNPVYTPRSNEEKKLQQSFLMYYKKENEKLIFNALNRINRIDLFKKLYNKKH